MAIDSSIYPVVVNNMDLKIALCTDGTVPLKSGKDGVPVLADDADVYVILKADKAHIRSRKDLQDTVLRSLTNGKLVWQAFGD